MQFNWADVLSLAVTLFFVMDPLGNTPVFHAILKQYQPRQKMQIITREMLIAFIILLAFLVTGTKILGFLGLSQPSLSIAGGILLFIIAIRMVFPLNLPAAVENESDPFIVPLAMPLVAGPSTIALLILQANSEPERLNEWIVSLVLAWIMTTAILVSSAYLFKFFGTKGLRSLERLMGMLLILIAVQMLLDGIADYVQGFL
ncbi:NAAT family transporter [bacterium]|nr:NAAT family transporter [bacterium]